MKLHKVIQRFDGERLADIPGAVRREMLNSGLSLPKGERIAVTAGSRGVANIAVIIKSVCDTVREMGGEPFVIPAMGSHGGATAEGQRELIQSYGITEEYVGAPIYSSMEVVELDSEGLEHRLFMDRYAHEAYGVIAVNRVKVHTDFHGPIESGVMKMCVIGLGKHAQALEMHSFGVYGLRDLVAPAARKIFESGKILLGIGALENGYDETTQVRAALPNDIEAMEMEMLDRCRTLMPSLPANDIDVLIVDRMGKDINGVGIDTNIIGRMRIRGEAEPEKPRIKMILVDDLTEDTHGNASGMGLADLITEKLRSKIDFAATYENMLTSSFIMRGAMPIAVENAREGLRHALRCCGRDGRKVMRIRDTLHISEIYVSEDMLEDMPDYVEITSQVIEAFDERGELSGWV